MAGTSHPVEVVVVDGTRKQCKGVIAELEHAMAGIGDGGSVHTFVADVPSRIDVRAWAERKGHRIQADERAKGPFHMVIVKKGKVLTPTR